MGIKYKNKPELLAPAGDWSMLNAAIKAGADAIYFGVESLNMRAMAKNFELKDLKEISNICKKNNIKAHLTLNSIIFEDELQELDRIISAAKDAGIDMIIGWDLSVLQKCKEYEMPFCISTQASISNSEAAKFYKNLGAKRIVLARECTLDKIIEIKNKVDIEIETFVHGAMCVAISGRCFMSHEVFNKSANRGECLQPCRREYEIVDKDEKFSLIIGDGYVLSPKDLCTVDFIDRLIEAKIDAFKIEGRKRSPEYIYKVVSVYRNAIDLYYENKLTSEIKSKFFEELSKVYNRGFSPGFYFGTPGEEGFTDAYGSKATTRKVYVGKVLNYYKKNKIAYVKIEAGELNVGDSIYIIGNTTGVVELTIEEMMQENDKLQKAERGNEITFPCKELVRENDKVYKIISTQA
ncbi:U32 family peptidase [Rosettibacter firmus]|uniref:U32 family peptidase n=1 Tax=Rosettibacter firmus TaxID=3111522 RepID=UPI00336C10D2